MYDLSDLLEKLNIPYLHTGRKNECLFEIVLPYDQSNETSLIFFNKPEDKTLDLLQNNPCSVILVEKNWGMNHLDKLNAVHKSIFLVENPRLTVGRLLTLLYPDEDAYYRGIHPTASIDPEANIHPTASIGPYCIIGKCEIGENSRIDAFSIIKDATIIGKNVIIREHCIIGICGFGLVRNQDNTLERIPHIGRVVIEDSVEIFPHSTIDRGMLGETRIRRGTKIALCCHIGHNTTIGEDCVLVSEAMLCGGSKLGSRSWAGVGSVIKEKVSVGDNVTIGIGAVVTHDVENGQIVAGIPARPLHQRRPQ